MDQFEEEQIAAQPWWRYRPTSKTCWRICGLVVLLAVIALVGAIATHWICQFYPHGKTTDDELNIQPLKGGGTMLAGATECKLCDSMSGLTKDVTCLTNKSCFKKTEELVKFHCLKP